MTQKTHYDKGEMAAEREGKKIICIILNPSWNSSSILIRMYKENVLGLFTLGFYIGLPVYRPEGSKHPQFSGVWIEIKPVGFKIFFFCMFQIA